MEKYNCLVQESLVNHLLSELIDDQNIENIGNDGMEKNNEKRKNVERNLSKHLLNFCASIF